MTHLEIIRNEMWRQKVSITKMAEKVGKSRQSISEGLSLKTDIKHSTVQKMADELGLKLIKNELT